MVVGNVTGTRMGLLMLCLLGAVGQCVLALELGESCTNPRGLPGNCILFRECPELVAVFGKPIATPEDTQYLQDSRCGSSGRKALVCCAGSTAPANTGNSVLPEPPHCGIQLTDRIFGGQPTQLDEFPWAVLIEYQKPNGRYGFHCGGSLINERYVLTAAHCIVSIPRTWKVHRVRLGEWDLGLDRDCNGDGDCNDAPVDMNIEKIVVHTGYDTQDKNHLNDIALIRMASPVAFTETVRPICLPLSSKTINANHVGLSSWAAGWGKTETASASQKKLKVELKVKSLQQCSPVYQRNGIFLQSTQLCAGGVNGQDTCSGDSGGPLMRQFAGAWYLIAVVSFGPSKCGTADVPGVYTDVAKFGDWIRQNVY
ncbi:CLIP domain-containing serine protease B4-like [Anopheles ziemanni]|uniref:CLIP domain-containing serine protease B4-like n=1 Tax=Anopheles coustani TaxID=139045 RepID=UPI00265AEB54|nr:CLIP domain-containing serine protease B4-like [Anopheles coustani]XP_058169086.1 CLIP domain-containing serine protease B4-like [Anopheles ziemanni]